MCGELLILGKISNSPHTGHTRRNVVASLSFGYGDYIAASFSYDGWGLKC